MVWDGEEAGVNRLDWEIVGGNVRVTLVMADDRQFMRRQAELLQRLSFDVLHAMSREGLSMRERLLLVKKSAEATRGLIAREAKARGCELREGRPAGSTKAPGEAPPAGAPRISLVKGGGNGGETG